MTSAARKPRYRRINGSFKAKRNWRWRCLKLQGSVEFNSATSALTVVTARNPLFCVVSMNKAADLSRMYIAIKRFICKILICRCLRGQVAADGQSMVSLNMPDNALTNGRPHKHLVLGSDWPCVRAKKAYWLPITCTPRFGFGMVKKKRRAVGISWCVGKSARTTFPIIVYRMRRWIQPGKSWHGCRRNVSSLNTVFGRLKANVAWPTIKFAAGMHGTIIWH